MSCSGLPAGGFGEWHGHADKGDPPQLAYTASHSADHAEAVSPQLYNKCTAR